MSVLFSRFSLLPAFFRSASLHYVRRCVSLGLYTLMPRLPPSGAAHASSQVIFCSNLCWRAIRS